MENCLVRIRPVRRPCEAVVPSLRSPFREYGPGRCGNNDFPYVSDRLKVAGFFKIALICARKV